MLPGQATESGQGEFAQQQSWREEGKALAGECRAGGSIHGRSLCTSSDCLRHRRESQLTVAFRCALRVGTAHLGQINGSFCAE
jgi:hypothetical protein